MCQMVPEFEFILTYILIFTLHSPNKMFILSLLKLMVIMSISASSFPKSISNSFNAAFKCWSLMPRIQIDGCFSKIDLIAKTVENSPMSPILEYTYFREIYNLETQGFKVLDRYIHHYRDCRGKFATGLNIIMSVSLKRIHFV